MQIYFPSQRESTNVRKPPLMASAWTTGSRSDSESDCGLASVSRPDQRALQHKYKLKIPQIHIYTNRSGPSNAGGSLTIYNASFLYMPRIKLFLNKIHSYLWGWGDGDSRWTEEEEEGGKAGFKGNMEKEGGGKGDGGGEASSPSPCGCSWAPSCAAAAAATLQRFSSVGL